MPERSHVLSWGLCVMALCGLAVFIWWMSARAPKEISLHGVLVDLELQPAESERHIELREALTSRLSGPCSSVQELRIELDCVHFSRFTRDYLNAHAVDFIVLSPQGTPWHLYARQFPAELESVKALVRELVSAGSIPVMGICGGHQFMSLAFGGSVDFIDPGFTGAKLDRYPKEAVSERGPTVLETLGDDPIFQGVAAHPGQFVVVESHYEEVKRVPGPFINLARSYLSEAQLIRVPGKIVYGMAFHPERGWNDGSDGGQGSVSGKRILENFFLMVSRHKGSMHKVGRSP